MRSDINVSSRSEQPMKRSLIILSASLFALSAAHAGDLRTMTQQPGEWEVTMSGGIMPTTTQKGCYAGDKSITDLANRNMKNCSQKSVNISGGLATVDAVCQLQSLQVTVHSTIRPTGDAAFHSESHVQIAGMKGMGLPSEMVMSVDGHRTGPCQPGDKQM
jgi:hypothetical protein